MKIATIGHTVVSVHPAAVALGVGAAALGQSETAVAFVLALAAHEAAHGVAASLLHFSVPEMEFTPFGGVAKIEDLQSGSAGQQVGIAMAGPLISWLVCLAAYSILHTGLLDTLFVRKFLQANLLLALFNLLPVLPLDGGRVVFALLSPRLGWQRAVKLLSFGGVLLGALLLALAIWGAVFQKIANLTLVTAGCYLMYAAKLSAKTMIPQCIHGMILKKVRLERQGVLRVDIRAASAKSTIQELYRKLEPGSFHQVWVVDPGTLKVAGQITEAELEEALLATPLFTLQECLAEKKKE